MDIRKIATDEEFSLHHIFVATLMVAFHGVFFSKILFGQPESENVKLLLFYYINININYFQGAVET
jgi:hypothetical protein